MAAALAVTLSAGAQQTQKKQTQKQKQTNQNANTPFDPCTGDGLPATSQMAPMAPGAPGTLGPATPSTVKGGVTCSNGKCKPTVKDPYYEQNLNPGGTSLPLSPGATAAGKKNAAKSRNAFPLAKSEAAQKTANETNAPQPSSAQANPFPEAQSEAAQTARQKAKHQPPPDQGAYSSSNQRLPGVNALGNGTVMNDGAETHPAFDPELAKRDDKVGKFYLQSGDWAGAYGRYKQAAQVNPEDLNAVIGLAIAADHLGKRDVAIQNYKLYLDVTPHGKQSKDALKALKRLSTQK